VFAGTRQPRPRPDGRVTPLRLAVNLFGTYAVTRAFLPAVIRSRGAIVNILSVNALAPLPFIIPAYSVSKAAAFSLTQSLRARVAAQGVRVHAVLPGPVDTDMVRADSLTATVGTRSRLLITVAIRAIRPEADERR
jgi:NAD(P)-dependent dehydrogenase (short-subunit alcohol dehydrogenase family)